MAEEKVKSFVEAVVDERSHTPPEFFKEFDGGVAEFFGKPVPKKVKTDSVYFSKGSLACMGAVRLTNLTKDEEKNALKLLQARLKAS